MTIGWAGLTIEWADKTIGWAGLTVEWADMTIGWAGLTVEWADMTIGWANSFIIHFSRVYQAVIKFSINLHIKYNVSGSSQLIN
jgi:hypothetical protein